MGEQLVRSLPVSETRHPASSEVTFRLLALKHALLDSTARSARCGHRLAGGETKQYKTRGVSKSSTGTFEFCANSNTAPNLS